MKSLATTIGPVVFVAMFVPLAIAKPDSVLFTSAPPVVDGLTD